MNSFALAPSTMDIDFDEFTDVEKCIIREMARSAAHELDSLPDLEDE